MAFHWLEKRGSAFSEPGTSKQRSSAEMSLSVSECPFAEGPSRGKGVAQPVYNDSLIRGPLPITRLDGGWDQASGGEGPCGGFGAGTRIGKYEIVERIGSGGSGTVYRARHLGESGEEVALKILLPWLNDPMGLSRFQLEIRALADLEHPGIVKLLDHGTHDDGSPYLVMKLIEGTRLDDYTFGPESRSVVMAQRLSWFRQICAAVSAAHERQILHRDLKPGNIIIDQLGNAMITDFGLAKRMTPGLSFPELTLTGQIIGSPHYMAPEQAAGTKEVGMTTDVFGLGAVLYFMLTGKPPFGGSSLIEVCQSIEQHDPVKPRSQNRVVTFDLQNICLKCLEKNPNKRYPTVSALSDDVERYLAGKPIVARPVSPWERVGKWSRRNPIVAMLSTMVALLFLAGLFSSVALWRQSQHNLNRAESQRQLLLATIDQLSAKVKAGESDPSTLRSRLEELHIITETFDKLAEIAPLEDPVLYSSAVAWFKKGRVQGFLGRHKQKYHSYHQAEQRFRRLVNNHPDFLEYQFDLFHSLISQQQYDQAFAVIQKVVQRDATNNPHYRAALSNAYHWQSNLHAAQRNYDLAIEASNAGDAIAQEFFAHPDAELRYRRSLGTHAFDLAVAYWGKNDLPETKRRLNESIEQAVELRDLDLTDPGFHVDLVARLTCACSVAKYEGDFVAAEYWLDRAREASATQIDWFETYSDSWVSRAMVLELAWIHQCETGTLADQRAASREYVQMLEEWQRRFPEHDRAEVQLALHLTHPFNTDPDDFRALDLVDFDWEFADRVEKIGAAVVNFRTGNLERSSKLFDECYQHDQHRFAPYVQALKVLRKSDGELATLPDVKEWKPDEGIMRRCIMSGSTYSAYFLGDQFPREWERMLNIVAPRP